MAGAGPDRGVAYLLIADEPGKTGRIRVLGPTSAKSPIHSVRGELLADALQRSAGLPGLEAVRRIAADLTRMSGDGLDVNGLLTRHTLEHRLRGDPSRWDEAAELTRSIRPTDAWQHLFRKLGYTVEQLPHRGHLARAGGAPAAVIHPKRTASELGHTDRQGRPPEGLLLEDCEAQGAPFGVLAHGGRFRLFDARSESPASEWLELDLRLLGSERRPYVALLSPRYLAEGGFADLRTEARNFGVELHRRLDRTIRQDALPALATGMQQWANKNGISLRGDREREELEHAALTLVFRLVFILFCESAGHLPMGNRVYRRASLSSLVHEAHDTGPKLSDTSSALWSGFMRLVRAMRNGNPAWDMPAYNGPLFAPRDFPGAALLERMELRDPVFARVLVAVGQDQETKRGTDFSTLEIAHIGHTYESLLSLRLSLAGKPLRYDAKADRYVAVDRDEAEVRSGGLLWQTDQGGRKAGGVYYTPVDIVRHLVKGAVLPAYKRHLDEVADILTTDPERAARHLLSFAVVDPACGSAHFLVQVTEVLAEATVRFLARHPLPRIVRSMERLRSAASPGIEIDDLALLRRLLVKHCVFGVDRSAMGAEVATLSLWLASFVPGLSLSWLGRNVRVGDSLIGVADPGSVIPEGHLFTEVFEKRMKEATELVRAVAAIDDRTPEEVNASRKADRKATRATVGLKRLFDLWTAEQFGLEGARQHAELHGVEVIKGTDGDAGFRRESSALAKRHDFLHWPLAFPQVFHRERPGFDVVVGNPPWEEVTIEELSFYGMYRPGLNSMTQAERDRVIAGLVRERPGLPGVLRERQEKLEEMRTALAGGGYERSSGDPDLYKYFCQRYRMLARQRGFIGVVLPRSAFVNKGSTVFREWIYTSSATHRVDSLVNHKGWAFPDVTPKYTISLVVAERTPPPPGHKVAVAGTARSRPEWHEQAAGDGVRLAQVVFGPRWETPLLRSHDEAEVLAKLREGNPFPFGAGVAARVGPSGDARGRGRRQAGGRWSCFPVAELHETKQKDFWRDKTEGKPLWKGESFDQYDPHGAGERFVPETPALRSKVRKPRPGLKSLLRPLLTPKARKRAVRDELGRARLAFHDVSRATDPRTILAALIPPGVYLTNTAPYLAFVEGAEREQAACLALMNSLPFDWQARRFVEIQVSYFILEGLRVPALSHADCEAIADAAARLSAVDDRFAAFAEATGVECGPLDPGERQRLRVEIDARVARAWNLTVGDMEVIFRDFTEDAVTPAYRAAVVGRLEELT